MRNGNLLFSAVHFLLIIALFCIGGAFLGLHFLPEVQAQLAGWILKGGESFFFLGCLVLGVAFFLTICFWAMQRSSYIRVVMKKNVFSSDEALIQKMVRQYWREEFPSQKGPIDVYVARKRVEIKMAMPEEGEKSFAEIEERLGALLSNQLGYEKEFFVTFTN